MAREPSADEVCCQVRPGRLVEGEIERERVTGGGFNGREYDVTPDGQQFLTLKSDNGADGTGDRGQIVVVQNWHEELKARVPTEQ